MLELTEKDIEVVKWQVEQAKELVKQYPQDIIVLATYTDLEYKEFQPSTEPYHIYISKEKMFINLCRLHGIKNIVFENVDLFGYAKYLIDNKLENTAENRSAYVAQKFKNYNLKKDK